MLLCKKCLNELSKICILRFSCFFLNGAFFFSSPYIRTSFSVYLTISLTLTQANTQNDRHRHTHIRVTQTFYCLPLFYVRFTKCGLPCSLVVSSWQVLQAGHLQASTVFLSVCLSVCFGRLYACEYAPIYTCVSVCMCMCVRFRLYMCVCLNMCVFDCGS